MMKSYPNYKVNYKTLNKNLMIRKQKQRNFYKNQKYNNIISIINSKINNKFKISCKII